MANQALKNLCLQYVRGEISKPEYRLRRKQIIDEATGITGIVEARTSAADQTHKPNNLHTSPVFKAGIISAIIVVLILVLYTAI